jgi:hypothetical protein
MYEFASTVVRGVLEAIMGFFATVQGVVLGWIHGEDLTLLVVLVLVALLALFFFVPNRRRY